MGIMIALLWAALGKLFMSACNSLLSQPFHWLWNWKFRLQMNLVFQINTWQLFHPLGYSLVMSTVQYFAIRSSSVSFVSQNCSFHFEYFIGPSSHHQAHVAVLDDSDGRSAFRVGLWAFQCPANAILIQAFGWVCEPFIRSCSSALPGAFVL